MDKKEGRGKLRSLADRVLARVSPPVLGLFIVLGCGGPVVAAWAWHKHRSEAKEWISVEVRKGDIEDLVAATGALQPRDYVDVGAQVSGQLKKIHVQVGQVVKEGDLLAEIDAEQSAAKVEASLAQMRSLQAQLEQRRLSLVKAERDFTRYRNLAAEEATTRESVQNAETEVATIRAQMAQLRAQIDQLQATTRVEEANLKYTRIYAPMSGTVVSIAAKQGQTLNANQQAPNLMRIADLAVMTVQTQVSEADVSKLRVGMEAYFTTLGGQGRRWRGKLTRIEPTPTVTNNVVLYNALFDVPNDTRTLMTQMTAQVFFVVAQVRNVLVIPMSALNQIPGQRRLSASAGGAESRSNRRDAASGEGQVARAGGDGADRGSRRIPGEGSGEGMRPPMGAPATRSEAAGSRETPQAVDSEARAPRQAQSGEGERARRRPDGEGQDVRREATDGQGTAPRQRMADDESRAARRAQAGEGERERRRPDGEGQAARREATDGQEAAPRQRMADDESRALRRAQAGEGERERRRPDGEGQAARREATDGQDTAPRQRMAGDESRASRRAQAGEAEGERRRPDGEGPPVRRDADAQRQSPRPEGRSEAASMPAAEGSTGGERGDAAAAGARGALRPGAARDENGPRSARQTAAGQDPADVSDSPPGNRRASGQNGSPRREVRIKVLLPDGRIEERKITLGVSNRIHAEVISGLEDGEKVIAGVREPEKPRGDSSASRQPSSSPMQQQMPAGAGMPGGMARGR